MPLENVGESIGMAKLPMPGDDAPREVWDEYCQRDVEITFRVVHEWWRFLKQYDLGSFGPTLAAQSFRAFRHRFMDHQILIDNNPRASLLARESLHGGRTECFKIGPIFGPVYTLDINSMYPAVMRDNDFPAILQSVVNAPSKRELRRWVEKYCVIAFVTLNTKRNRFGHVVDSRLVFPVGRFHTTLTTPDLIDALEHGEIDSVHEASLYQRAPIFRNFVESIYNLRLKAQAANNDVQSWLLKILMNSLYGKFAQRGTYWEECGTSELTSIQAWQEIDAQTHEVRSFRSFGGIVQEKSRNTESVDSHPAIASHVTAYARAHLYRLIQRAGVENVYYVDTDSLWCNANAKVRLDSEINPTRLGALKIEGTHEWVIIYGPKDYATPTKQKIKGIKKKARRIGQHTFTQEQWSSLKGLIRLGRTNHPTVTTVTKTLERLYKKGVVSQTGRVSPFRLSERKNR